VALITAALAALAPDDVTIIGVAPSRINGWGLPLSSKGSGFMLISY
jgi:hypothetical protein